MQIKKVSELLLVEKKGLNIITYILLIVLLKKAKQLL